MNWDNQTNIRSRMHEAKDRGLEGIKIECFNKADAEEQRKYAEYYAKKFWPECKIFVTWLKFRGEA